MTDRIWTDKYPAGTSPDIDTGRYGSILDVFTESCQRFADRPAYSNIGATITFGELDELSAQFASYLQHHTTLKPGDRIAVQMPNLIQFPIVVFGAMRAGMVVVNTNPMYTTREMEHQFNDAGVKAVVALANFGHHLEEVLPKTGIKHVIITQVADIHRPFKRTLMNFVVRRVKKMVPKHDIPEAVSFVDALRMGRRHAFKGNHAAQPGDIAVLQYTGGTTGVAKGAMLTHANLVSNMLQVKVLLTNWRDGQEVMVAPLPLYHIFSFTVCCMAMMNTGSHSVLITNPRDIPAVAKELSRFRFTAMSGLNTLFVAMMNNEQFRALDFSQLKFTIAGGMAMQVHVADQWEQLTGCKVCEGFGMTETSPVVCVNPPDAIQVGTIGIPVPSTDIRILDDDGHDVAMGQAGELCVKGPQVMKGYWQRPEATAEIMTDDGYLRTGDVAVLQPDGYLRIVDRKKDMILVSGFNVYPNEVEEVVASCPGVLECAAIGVPDDKSGEAVKVFVVRSNPALTRDEVMAHCREGLTGYKLPKHVEFRNDLPKSNVGKILRRELRNL